MSVSKPPNSIDKTIERTAVSTEPKANVKGNGGDQAQNDKAAQDVPPRPELTADGATKYLQHTFAISSREIDALINDLRRLREKLVADGSRVEQGVVEFATLNQSVVKLTEVVSDSVAHVKAPGLAEYIGGVESARSEERAQAHRQTGGLSANTRRQEGGGGRAAAEGSSRQKESWLSRKPKPLLTAHLIASGSA